MKSRSGHVLLERARYLGISGREFTDNHLSHDWKPCEIERFKNGVALFGKNLKKVSCIV